MSKFYPRIGDSSGIWNLSQIPSYIKQENWNAFGIKRSMFAYGHGTNSNDFSNIVEYFDNGGNYLGIATNAGTGRHYSAGASYGGDKALISYGTTSSSFPVPSSDIITKFDNTGTFTSPEISAGTARASHSAATYGSDKIIV
jgi:hypothetical protein